MMLWLFFTVPCTTKIIVDGDVDVEVNSDVVNVVEVGVEVGVVGLKYLLSVSESGVVIKN